MVLVLPRFQGLGESPLIDLRGPSYKDASSEPVQLIEGLQYRYAVSVGPGHFSTDKPELLEFDDESGRTGRLNVGNATGTLTINIFLNGVGVGSIAFEVRSTKLNYRTEYRWMLRDIADLMAEIVAERFAAAVQKFKPEIAADARTLYQRFAFLQSLLEDASFEEALQRVFNRPFVAWEDQVEFRSVHLGVRGGSYIARQIAKPRPRVLLLKTKSLSGRRQVSLPQQFEAQRTVETLDNSPNRFVKFALTRWREIANAVLDALRKEEGNAPVTRGIAEASAVVDRLDEYLAASLFRELGPVSNLPLNNPVLQRKEGYREIFRAFLQFELAASLSWDGGEDVYSAGQRNVATLYEYWVFIQIAGVVSRVCSTPLDLRTLFEETKNGLGLKLKRRTTQLLRGEISRLDRKISVEVWFNKTFSRGTIDGSSWSTAMRPDCSIRFKTRDGTPALAREVWLHFDAKYKIDEIGNLFRTTEGEQLDVDVSIEDLSSRHVRRDDILKMHAYRDAIHRTAGSYVVYPGDEPLAAPEYHEILPGLGAFALAPDEFGESRGAQEVEKFFNDVVNHIASQGSQFERNQYWEKESYSKEQRYVSFPAADFLEIPAADTIVLFGYVKSATHWTWIEANHLYNVRNDPVRAGWVGIASDLLRANLLVLYGPSRETVSIARIVSGAMPMSKEDLLGLGYPIPRGSRYLVFRTEPLLQESWTRRASFAAIDKLRAEKTGTIGAPFSLTWAQTAAVIGGQEH